MVKALLQKYFTVVKSDEDGELFIEFPDKWMDAMDWRPGDQIIWTELPNGQGWTLTKADRNDR